MTLGGEARCIEAYFSADDRGTFAKPFSWNDDPESQFQVRELFWSVSARGVVRGMHFQEPPRAAGKLVWVSAGRALDAVVDLREGRTFGTVQTFDLPASAGRVVWIPAGFAHGFQSLEDDTIVNYAVDDVYAPELDVGVRYDSVGVEWPLRVTGVSPRDAQHPILSDYATPFAGPSA